MGIHVLRRAADLGETFALAPERFDPRRTVEIVSGRLLEDVAEIVTESVTSRSFDGARPVLILDTTHAYEGFVVFRHDPVSAPSIGSAKRRLHPGDIIISRLRPYLRQVALVDRALFQLVPNGNDVCASTEFFVIRGRDGFDAAALVPFLLSEPVQTALAAGQEGGHHPRFSKELLASMRVPECILEEAADTARQVRDLAAGVRRSLAGCRDLVSTVQRRLQDGAPASSASCPARSDL